MKNAKLSSLVFRAHFLGLKLKRVFSALFCIVLSFVVTVFSLLLLVTYTPFLGAFNLVLWLVISLVFNIWIQPIVNDLTYEKYNKGLTLEKYYLR